MTDTCNLITVPTARVKLAD